MAYRDLELPLRSDGSGRFLPWTVALMVYLASLALALLLVVHQVVKRWDVGLSGTMTVELPPAHSGNRDDGALALALGVLRNTPGVLYAEPLDRTRVAALLAPWLGTDFDTTDLPLPRLIDLHVDPGANIDTTALGARIAAAVPGAQLDDHRRWIERVLRLALAIEVVAALVVLLVGCAAALAVVFATRAGLAVHQSIIEVLHLIGAPDVYIARQFARHALRLSIAGGMLGLLLAALTLLGLGAAAQEAGVLDSTVRLLPLLQAPPAWCAILLVLPISAGLVAMATARLTVLRTLARMP
jgi:cell division transport system permease protein